MQYKSELSMLHLVVVSRQHSLQETYLTTRMTKKVIMMSSAGGGRQMLGLISHFLIPQTLGFNHIVKQQLYYCSIGLILSNFLSLFEPRSSRCASVTWKK